MSTVRDATAIRDDLRTLGRLPVTLADQGAPLRLAGDVAPLLDRCGFLERVLERAERERDDAVAELAVLRAQRDAALAICDKALAECGAAHEYVPMIAIGLARRVRAALEVQPEPDGWEYLRTHDCDGTIAAHWRRRPTIPAREAIYAQWERITEAEWTAGATGEDHVSVGECHCVGCEAHRAAAGVQPEGSSND